MNRKDLEAQPHFSQPVRQVLLMLLVLGLSAAGGWLALPSVLPVFTANPWLNGFILMVFVIGVFSCFWQVGQLIVSVLWIERFVEERVISGARARQAPQLLATLATLLRTRDKRMQINTTSSRTILDSIGTRIDEAREITRYIVSLLIFLGLLGTFYGLATTIPALVDTIRSLAPQEGENSGALFTRLMGGLESQLGGMGVAFGSSLLGLAASLIVGLLELFAAHGQNRFYRELEEWLSTITRIGFSSETEGGPDLGAAGVIMDRMAEQLEKLEEMFVESQAGRAQADSRLEQLATSVERMAERIEASSPSAQSLTRIAEGQDRLIEVLQNKESAEGLDAESRMRLRSIDVQMLRILEEIAAGRQESMAELRTDLAAVTRTLGQLRAPAPAAAGQQPIRPTPARGGPER